jgi:predicted Zn-dependent protease
MLAPFSRISLVAVSPLLMLAIGCNDGGTPKTTTAAGSVAAVNAPVQPPATGSTPETVTPKVVSYSDGEAAFKAGRYEEAAQLFGSYTERKPENPWGFYMLGLSSWKSGNVAQADVAFGEALKLDPKHQKSLLNSARVLIELGRTDEALDRVQAALALDSTSAESWRVAGRVQAERGKTDEAIDAFRHAIALDDHDVWAMNNLALIYIQQGCPAEALAPLARATQLKPGAPVFQNNLGQALEATGHPAAAEQAYQAALQADSSYQKASIALARVAARGEDSTEAAVDLVALAREFQAGVEQWRDHFAQQAQVGETTETAGVSAPDSMARDSTSEVVSRPDSEH